MDLFIKKLLEEAGEIAISKQEKLTVHRKKDQSLVSEVDYEIELFLKNRILKEFPNDLFIGEEYGIENFRKERQKRIWAIDPIDGTNPYIKGLPTWGICIGLMDENTPLAGGFYMPKTKELFIGEKGKGATINGKKMLNLKEIEIEKQAVVFVPSSRKRFFNFRFSGKSVAYGSASTHIAYTAAGCGIAALVDRPKIWDVLAPLAILKEVGGGGFLPNGHSIDLLSMVEGKKIEGPVFFGTRENVEKVLPNIEIFPRPEIKD
ncbi:MAG: inositol monophosphatase [Nitrospinota bacterium]|nr:inositol monophosphatase [Nitrospinota bacterium]